MTLLLIIYIWKATLRVVIAASKVEFFPPSIVAKEQAGKDADTFLIAGQKVICQVEAHKAPLSLLAAYCAFKGLTSLYTLFEMFFKKHTKTEPQIVSRQNIHCFMSQRMTVTNAHTEVIYMKLHVYQVNIGIVLPIIDCSWTINDQNLCIYV